MPRGWPGGTSSWGTPMGGGANSSKGSYGPSKQAFGPPGNQSKGNAGYNSFLPVPSQTSQLACCQQQLAMLTQIARSVNNIDQNIKRLRLGGGSGGSGGGGAGGTREGLGSFSRLMHLIHGARQFGHGMGSGSMLQMAGGAVNLARGAGFLGGGGGGSAAGAGAGAGMGAAGAVAGVAVAAVAVVAGFVALKKAADDLVESQRDLAQVSPSMAGVYAARDIQEILRNRQKGEMLANATGNLTREEQRFKDAMMPMETAWEEFKANFLAGFYANLADLAETANEIATTLGIIEKRGKESAMDQSFSGQVNKIADEAEKKQAQAKNDARRPR